MAECKWKNCRKIRQQGQDFCREHQKEAIARLFPNHPEQGKLFPTKRSYPRRRGESR